jgi:osmotically-inducible protein OsmY
MSVPLLAVAEARLQASPYIPIRRVACRFDKGSLVLNGSVPSFFHKQLAQQAVADIEGIAHVDNQIRVVD